MGNSLELNNDFIIANKISHIFFCESDPLVIDLERHFTFERNSGILYLNCQRFLIDRLKKATTQFTMNSHHTTCDVIRLFWIN